MSYDIKLPNINGKTTAEQMSQMKSYMYQMVEQLNWALNKISSVEETAGTNISKIVVPKESSSSSERNAQADFNEIKSLIIKSADIVDAYQKIMTETFDKSYLATSAYGTFTSYVDSEITKSAEGIRQDFKETQEIVADNKDYIKNIRACIKHGDVTLPTDKDTVYGVSVGQTVVEEKDGAEKETFNAFARFTADRLEFFEKSSNKPVAYISNRKLYITNAQILDSIIIGKYIIDTTDGIVFRWNGGGTTS